MRRFSRSLILLAAIVLAAKPVVACCLTGHAQSQRSAATAEAPPCHGANTEHAPEEQDGTCPGCANCDAGLAHASAAGDAAVALLVTALDLPPATVGAAPPFAAPMRVRATGPPRASPPRSHTPVSLKQRLLI